jgi:hypothetical protein
MVGEGNYGYLITEADNRTTKWYETLEEAAKVYPQLKGLESVLQYEPPNEKDVEVNIELIDKKREDALDNYKEKNEPINPLFEKIVKRGTYFKTDYETLEIWKEHLKKCYYENNSEYIVFNYNIFLCNEDKKKEIFDKLDITYNPNLFKYTSTFGHGSSYGSTQTVTDSIINYYSRFNEKICEDALKDFFKSIFKNEEIINDLNTHFAMKLILDDGTKYTLEICNGVNNKSDEINPTQNNTLNSTQSNTLDSTQSNTLNSTQSNTLNSAQNNTLDSTQSNTLNSIKIDMSDILTGGDTEQYYKNKYKKYKIKYNNLKLKTFTAT